MNKKEIEAKYGVHLVEAPITGGADIQPHDWLKDYIVPSLEEFSRTVIPVSQGGGLYVIHWDEEGQSGSSEHVYGKDSGYVARRLRAMQRMNPDGDYDFWYSTEVAEEFEDFSVGYFFMRHGCLFVIECEESMEDLHNDARVVCVWKGGGADLETAQSEIAAKLEEGMDDIITERLRSGAVVSTGVRGDVIDFAFWYVREANE